MFQKYASKQKYAFKEGRVIERCWPYKILGVSFYLKKLYYYDYDDTKH
jgi:hypothetical protein